jgi:hypothetical protein
VIEKETALVSVATQTSEDFAEGTHL